MANTGCPNKYGPTPATSHTADVKMANFPVGYQPSQLLYYCKIDGGQGVVADRRQLTFFPAGYTIDSQYYLKVFTPPPPASVGAETCAGANMDAGGRFIHRVAGVPEYTAQLLYVDGKPDGNGWKNGFNETLLLAHPAFVNALNAFLVSHPAHGCTHWPCSGPPPPDPHAKDLAVLKVAVDAAVTAAQAVQPCKDFLAAMGE